MLSVEVDKRTLPLLRGGVVVDELGATLLRPALHAGVEGLARWPDEVGDVEVGLGRVQGERDRLDLRLVELRVSLQALRGELAVAVDDIASWPSSVSRTSQNTYLIHVRNDDHVPVTPEGLEGPKHGLCADDARSQLSARLVEPIVSEVSLGGGGRSVTYGSEDQTRRGDESLNAAAAEARRSTEEAPTAEKRMVGDDVDADDGRGWVRGVTASRLVTDDQRGGGRRYGGGRLGRLKLGISCSKSHLGA